MFIARIFTLYPEFFPGPLAKGLYGKALVEKIWKLETVNIRDYAEDKHKTVDDTTYADAIGAAVSVKHTAKGKGKLTIEYATLDQLDGIIARLEKH